jgi:hypothetical protein
MAIKLFIANNNELQKLKMCSVDNWTAILIQENKIFCRQINKMYDKYIIRAFSLNLSLKSLI